jgi:hypothetical protein
MYDRYAHILQVMLSSCAISTILDIASKLASVAYCATNMHTTKGKLSLAKKNGVFD